MPVMVVYTANASGGIADLQDNSAVALTIWQFHHPMSRGAIWKDDRHPVPHAVLNPIFIGAMRQGYIGYAAGASSE